MLEEEGLANVFKRHDRHAEATRRAVRAWGLEILCADPAEYSSSLTAVMMPPGHDADAFRAVVLRHFDMSLGQGLTKLSGKIFRIGHLGDFNDLMLMGSALRGRDGTRARRGPAPEGRHTGRHGAPGGRSPQARGRTPRRLTLLELRTADAPARSGTRRITLRGDSMDILKQVVLGIAAATLGAGAFAADVTLRASHQFPGGKGDVRDDMVQMIAKEAKAANVGLEIQVYPGASLFKPNDQWNAMVGGQLDMTLFPLDYASGKVPAFSATLMPGLIRSQERAKRINQSQFMKDVRAEIEKHGVIVLSDAWFAGGMASKGNCIVHPNDLKGLKFRAAGPTFAAMWESAGASIVSPPSNEIYNAFQSGVVNATDTSLGTFASMRLYEVTDCLTAPGDNALWFMYEPVLMSKKTFDRLDAKQKQVILDAGKKAQAYYEGKAEVVNQETIKAFTDHKAKVVTLSDADYDGVARRGQEERLRAIRGRTCPTARS